MKTLTFGKCARWALGWWRGRNRICRGPHFSQFFFCQNCIELIFSRNFLIFCMNFYFIFVANLAGALFFPALGEQSAHGPLFFLLKNNYCDFKKLLFSTKNNDFIIKFKNYLLQKWIKIVACDNFFVESMVINYSKLNY